MIDTNSNNKTKKKNQNKETKFVIQNISIKKPGRKIILLVNSTNYLGRNKTSLTQTLLKKKEEKGMFTNSFSI